MAATPPPPSTGNFATTMEQIQTMEMNTSAIQAETQMIGNLSNGLTAAVGEVDHA